MSVSNVLFPKVTQVSDTAELRAFMRRIVKFTGLLAVATLPALPIVSFWIPHEEPRHGEAVSVFMLMYAGPLSSVLYSLGGLSASHLVNRTLRLRETEATRT